MASGFDLDAMLRRIKPYKRRGALRRRARLPFVSDDVSPADIGPVLLDTSVYLDAGKHRLPPGAARLVSSGRIVHCAVAVAELTFALGRLDPAHPQTRSAHEFLRDLLARIPDYRTVSPSAETYAEAGIVAGVLTRTQGLSREQHRKFMFDSLIFLTAKQYGLTLLTANAGDFDLIHQLVPMAKPRYYRPLPA